MQKLLKTDSAGTTLLIRLMVGVETIALTVAVPVDALAGGD